MSAVLDLQRLEPEVAFGTEAISLTSCDSDSCNSGGGKPPQ